MSSSIKINEHILILRKALSLHNAMVIYGERPSEASEALFREAMNFDSTTGVADQGKGQQLALDVSLEKARALHRVWRALNDGDCPKCHNAVAATDVIRPNLKGGVWIKCPNPDCGFHVTGEEITEIERMFAPAMNGAVAIFEEWRATRATGR